MSKEPYDIAQIFHEMELFLIQSMARNFKRHRMEEIKEGFEWSQWQYEKLRSLRKFRADNEKIVNAYGALVEKEAEDLLLGSYHGGQRRVNNRISRLWDQIIDYLEIRGIVKPKPRLIPIDDKSFFGMNSTKINSLLNSVNGDFRKARYAILRKMDDVYRQTIYRSEMYMSSGAVSLNQAIDMASKDFLEKGINCIVYSNGRQVNIASYAEMSLRTASQRATFMGEGDKRNEWGVHTVVVSAHGTSCELCLPWQGKVLVDDVYSGGKSDGEHPLLSTAMEAGLLHPNCRHTVATYFPGITELPSVPNQGAVLRNYEAEQRQRYIERNVKKYRRLEAGSVDEENKVKYGQKLTEWKRGLRQHLKENPQLRRNYSKY